MPAAGTRQWPTAVAACVVLLLGPGCSEPEQAAYQKLPATFASEAQPAPLLAEEAFIGSDEFFVRYRRGDEVFFGGGRWSNRINLLAAGEHPQGATPYILPLERQGKERWGTLPEPHFPIRILDIPAWEDFKLVLVDTLLAPYREQGLLLHFNVDDYFIYFDEDGAFQATVIDQKPAEYEIGAQIAFPDLFKRGLPILEQWLQNAGIEERRIAFNTGDTGNYSLPFLYVNRDLPLAAFVRQPLGRGDFIPASSATPLVQTAGHVTGSHTTGLIFRPLSSVYRLLFVVSDTVAETVKPDQLMMASVKPVPPVGDGPPMDLSEFETLLDDITGREATRGTVDYLVDGESFFSRFVDAVVSARESIALRTYIFDNDDYAARIGELLKRRSKEGIEVRILLDGLGTIISTIEEQETLPEDYSGPASVHQFLERESGVRVRQAANPWLTGDHVKTAIIDKTIAFTGGMNIAREYRYDWHDLMVELHGPVVGILQHEFEKAWVHAGLLGDLGLFVESLSGPEEMDSDVGVPLRVLFTKTDKSEIFAAQLEAIRRARSYIYVQNAYFTDDVMLYELAQARRRGVDVRVIMPLVTDRGPITRNNALAANALLQHGVRIFVYPGMSHVKAAVFDGWACVGSANWDRWSFRINRELNIATSDAGAVANLEEVLFNRDFARSVEMTELFPERWSDHLLEIIGDYIF